MIISHMEGGLGNQMFEYAFAYAASQKKNVPLQLDLISFKTDPIRDYELDIFTITATIADEDVINNIKYKKISPLKNLYRKLRGWSKDYSEQCYIEPHFEYDKEAFNTKGDTYYLGFWQSEKYFKEYRENLLKEFTLTKPISEITKRYEQKIRQVNSVSLHVRRGDYIDTKEGINKHGSCSIEYYQRAIKLIEENIDTPYYFIFSDDIEWVKKHINFMENIIYIELGDDIPNHEDMYLMSQCKHNIIANSSFSWWGAWLNNHSDKIVISPKKWFNDTSFNTADIIPNDWHKL